MPFIQIYKAVTADEIVRAFVLFQNARKHFGCEIYAARVYFILVYDKILFTLRCQAKHFQPVGGADAAARANAIAVAVQAGMTVEDLAKVRFVTGPSGHAAWDPIQSACAAAK